MSLITWDYTLSVNVAEIDQQHQKLIGIINGLHDAMKAGKSKDVLQDIVDELVRYTVTHFKAEESYFDQFGYPETEEHKKEHATFVRKISEIKDKVEKGRVYLSVEVMNFLRDWLQNHIRGTDKRYTSFFNEKGLR